jgi:hypothetical protein
MGFPRRTQLQLPHAIEIGPPAPPDKPGTHRHGDERSYTYRTKF